MKLVEIVSVRRIRFITEKYNLKIFELNPKIRKFDFLKFQNFSVSLRLTLAFLFLGSFQSFTRLRTRKCLGRKNVKHRTSDDRQHEHARFRVVFFYSTLLWCPLLRLKEKNVRDAIRTLATFCDFVSTFCYNSA